MDVKFGQTQIAKPHINPDNTLPTSITLSVVEIKERATTVVGKEQPIHWILLSSHPVENVEQALPMG